VTARAELILAVDTSGADAGLVLAGGDRTDIALLASRPGGFARTEDLAAEASTLLAARGCTPRDLTLLGAVVGPGSYTGLRSGLAFLRGLAFAGSLPAVAVGTLELLAWRGAKAGETVVAISAAGAGRYAAATYRRDGDDVLEVDAPCIVEAQECRGFFAEAGRRYAAAVTAAASAQAPPAEAASRQALDGADIPSPLASAAHEAGLVLRLVESGALEQLALLVASRSRSAQTVGVESLLPIYVGQASARPNRHRVAVLNASE
jgi:tRNA threonylcarbamoyl adenosine modification protein YeaZ